MGVIGDARESVGRETNGKGATTMSDGTSAADLAVNGGTPVRSEPMPARGVFSAEEKAAAVAVFDRAIETGAAFGYNGPDEQAYEQAFAEWMGGGFADGVSSGTAAVFVALGALELEAGSEVIVPAITDPGGAMPVAMLNLIPVPVDTAPGTYNMGPEGVAAALTDKTRAVIVAHIGGDPADIGAIMEVAREHDLKVVEDAAQAHGSRYHGELVGTFGDVAAFSTMSGKHLASGAQGGVVYTKDEDLHWRAKRFADRGKPFNLEGEAGNVVAGLNLNLNDLSAAIGTVQLAKLPETVAARRRVAAAVRDGIAGLGAVSLGREVPDTESSYWFLRVRVDTAAVSVAKAEFAAAVAAEGIPVVESYRAIPVERPWFRDNETIAWCPWLFRGKVATEYDMPNAVEVTDTHFNVQIHESMGDAEAADIAKALAKVESACLKG